MNFNTFAVAVAPGDKLGRPAIVSLDPYALSGRRARKQRPHRKSRAAARTLQVNRVGDGRKGERLVASGTIAADLPMQKIYRSVGDPVQASGEYVKAFLKRRRHHRARRRQIRQKPDDATLVYTLESYEMRRIVAGLNTFSNNFIADTLVKRLGAAFPRRRADAAGSGTLANGIAVVNDFLRRTSASRRPTRWKTAPGLATENRLSAHQVVRSSPTWSAAWTSSRSSWRACRRPAGTGR